MKKYFLNTFLLLLLLYTLAGCVRITNKTNASLVSMPDTSFSKEEYKKLLNLRFDGYEDMSISKYQSKVWALVDDSEYLDLLERFSKSNALYECRDSDETASFLFYILEPVTAEKWQKREFSDCTVTDYPDCADNALLEWTLTLIIKDREKLTVGEYNAAHVNITNSLKSILRDKTQKQLQDKSFIQAEMDMTIEKLKKQFDSEKLGIDVEYVYTPLSLSESNSHVQTQQEQEHREFPNGTKADYHSLLSLKTPDYQKMSIADFNSEVLEWMNENYKRMERINCDICYNDFSVLLTADERRFVSLSVNFSGIENAKQIQSNYTGKEEIAPSYDQYLTHKADEKNGHSAWCDLYYRFSYRITDKEALTVGERDRCIGGMMADIQEFWETSELDSLLKMEKAEVVQELQKIADFYSTKLLTITIVEDDVFFECMDERSRELETNAVCDISDEYKKLMMYKTNDYAQQNVADFNNTINDDYPEFSEVYEAVVSNILPSDENYDFVMLTLSATVGEIYFQNVEKTNVFSVDQYLKKESQPAQPLSGEEEILAKNPVYNFIFHGFYRIKYKIPNPSALTVGERDYALKTISTKMQKYVDGLSEDEIMSGNIRMLLTDKAAEIADSVSSNYIKLSCEIEDIEIYNADEIIEQ